MSVLNRHTLVLNKLWQAINVRTVARALCMVWAENARIVDVDNYAQYTWSDWLTQEPGEEFIQCIGTRIKIPEVITLVNYSKVPTRNIAFSRRNIFTRDKHTCQYCGKQPGSKELTIDHVLPKSRSGKSTWTNCVLSCVECNFRKADRTPEEAKMRLRKEPKQPIWNPGFHVKRPIPSWEKFLSEMYWSVELEE